MRRRNPRTKVAETVKKKTDPQFGFKFPDPSSSRADSDSKRRRRVTFDDVDQRSPLNEAQAGPSVDAKTSEFAFFNKLKSEFGLFSKSSNSKSPISVKQNPKAFDSRVNPGEYAGTDSESNDKCKSNSFSTPIHKARRGVNLSQNDIEKDPGKSSSGLSRDKGTVRSGNNLRSEGISDEKGDIFSVKRKKLHRWVRDTWHKEIPELTSNGRDLVSLLLARLAPGTEDTPPSRLFEERTDRVKRRTFVDSPGSKFLKRSYENCSEVDRSLQRERDRLTSWQGWLENSIAPRQQFATDHVHSSFIPRDPEEISFSISYPKDSVYRPPLLKQRASLSFPVEETLDCSPISTFHFRNCEPLSLDYHRDKSEYSREDLSHEYREPSSALLLEWNTETAGTRETDDLPLNYDTKLITYPSASSSSLTDNPWSSDYSSSHDLVARDQLYPLSLLSQYTSYPNASSSSLTDDPWSSDYSSSHDLVAKDQLYPLPLLSQCTSDRFLLPTTNQTSHFEREVERRIFDDDDVVAANQNLLPFHHRNSSDCLTRDYSYYHNLSNSSVDHFPFEVPGCEIVSFPFSSISNSNLLEASSPTRSDHFKSHDLIPFQFQSPQAWIDS